MTVPMTEQKIWLSSGKLDGLDEGVEDGLSDGELDGSDNGADDGLFDGEVDSSDDRRR